MPKRNTLDMAATWAVSGLLIFYHTESEVLRPANLKNSKLGRHWKDLTLSFFVTVRLNNFLPFFINPSYLIFSCFAFSSCSTENVCNKKSRYVTFQPLKLVILHQQLFCIKKGWLKNETVPQ